MHKLILNRLANLFIRAPFQLRYNDITNAFALPANGDRDRADFIASFQFEVELPLKAIIRGYRFAVIPISWTNRTSGFQAQDPEMGAVIVLYCFIEWLLSRGDYRRGGV
jgi:dolichol-phosphate mannosyltransferase